MKRTILFICTGNYYRSRFAELLFNSLAEQLRLDWRATSRGAAAETSRNIGPISPFTLEGLSARGIAPGPAFRYPIQLQARDLRQAERIIALNQVEHRPLMEALFPEWASRLEYWHVPDLDRVSPGVALYAIERRVLALVQELSRAQNTARLAARGG